MKAAAKKKVQDYIFVYGSLRPDINVNIFNRFMSRCTSIGYAQFQGRMFIVDNRSETDKAQGANETTTVEVPSEMKKYPAVIPSENQNHKVRGMLFSIPEEHSDSIIKELDDYENGVAIDAVPEYRREKVVVQVQQVKESSSLDQSAKQMMRLQDYEAWMYVWARSVDGLQAVESGDYLSVYSACK